MHLQDKSIIHSSAHQEFVRKAPEVLWTSDLSHADRLGAIMLGKPFKRAKVRVFNTKLEVVSLQTVDSSLYLIYQRLDAINLESSTNLLGKTLRPPANGSRNGAFLAAPSEKCMSDRCPTVLDTF